MCLVFLSKNREDRVESNQIKTNQIKTNQIRTRVTINNGIDEVRKNEASRCKQLKTIHLLVANTTSDTQPHETNLRVL